MIRRKAEKEGRGIRRDVEEKDTRGEEKAARGCRRARNPGKLSGDTTPITKIINTRTVD